MASSSRHVNQQLQATQAPDPRFWAPECHPPTSSVGLGAPWVRVDPRSNVGSSSPPHDRVVCGLVCLRWRAHYQDVLVQCPSMQCTVSSIAEVVYTQPTPLSAACERRLQPSLSTTCALQVDALMCDAVINRIASNRVTQGRSVHLLITAPLPPA